MRDVCHNKEMCVASMKEPIVHATIDHAGKDLEVLLFDDVVIVFDENRGVRVGDHSMTDAPHSIKERLETRLAARLTEYRSFWMLGTTFMIARHFLA